MRYLCLVHLDGDRLRALSPAEQQELDRRCLAYDEELRQQGHYLASAAIEEPASAVLVRVRNGNMATTDGPYIETKEAMAGFLMIEARDFNEAVRLAAGIPIGDLGTIEVRAVHEIPTPPPLS